MNPSTQCFTIFEGGGAKGITHLGALKATEEVGITNVGTAGASAGAIVAALSAAGFKADHLYDVAAGTDILAARGLTPLDLLGRADWSSFKRLRVGILVSTFAYLMPLFLSFDVFALSQRLGRPRVFSGIWRLFKVLGFFSTEPARDLLNEILRDELRARPGPAVPDLVRFKDISPIVRSDCCLLKIIATNITQGTLELFDDSCATVVVADAVAASFAIPLFFKPARIRMVDDSGRLTWKDDSYADGGLVSNLPVWVFFEEKRTIERAPANKNFPPIPIVAFVLDPEGAAARTVAPSPLGRLVAHVTQVLNTGIFGGQSVVQRFVPNLTVVKLPTPLGVLAFDCTRARANEAFEAGRTNAVRVMRMVFRTRPADCNAALGGFLATVRRDSDALRDAHPVKQFRASLIVPEGKTSFRLVAAANMDDDADDSLLLDAQNPGAPTAYADRQIRILTPYGASTDLRMTKYERALVRPTLATVFCIPIFSDIDQWSHLPDARNEPVGVLCLDSDTRLDVEMSDPGFIRMLQVESLRFASLALDMRVPP